jgi:hypothetical protein
MLIGIQPTTRTVRKSLGVPEEAETDSGRLVQTPGITK